MTKTNRNDKEIDSAARSPLDYLKEIIAPTSEYIGGEKKGRWLEDEVPNIWILLRGVFWLNQQEQQETKLLFFSL
jgi:hypothetical protein